MHVLKWRNRKILKIVLMSILLLTAGALLSACVVPTVTSPADATAAAEVRGDVETTVEAAIALAVKATLTATAPDVTGPDAATSEDGGSSTVTTDTPDEEGALDNEAAVVGSENSEVPMLITPTPDRSAEITQMIVANTRHFRGDPDAPITLIEFSDFL